MSAVEKFFRDLMKDLLVEAVEHAVTRLRTPSAELVNTPAANDDNNNDKEPVKTSADKAEVITGNQSTTDYEALKADCKAIISALAPTHGPQIREMFAEHGIKRLSDAGDQILPAIFERLETLKNAK